MSVATASRNLLRIQIFTLIHFIFRAIRRLVRVMRGKPSPRSFALYPTVSDPVMLGDLVNRIAWYLPTDQVEVTIPCTADLLQADLSQLPVPSAQHRYLDTMRTRVRLVEPGSIRLEEAGAILLWKWQQAFRILPLLHKVRIVDPLYFSVEECANWAELLYESLDTAKRDALRERSRQNFQHLTDHLKGTDTAYVFTSGPSLDLAHDFEYRPGSLRIICNSIVKNQSLLEKLCPQVVVFADPVFHFSPCLYDAEFRKYVRQTLEKFQSFCIVPESQYGLLLAHFPEFEDRLIGMPVKNGDGWNLPSLERFYAKGTDNIMTFLMVPLAAAFAKEVGIIGADGRQKGERYFWRHSSQNQFNDLMQSVVDTHPSFFRDRVYTDYYDQHCETVESQLRFVEQHNVSCYALTPSFIPALVTRYREPVHNDGKREHLSESYGA